MCVRSGGASPRALGEANLQKLRKLREAGTTVWSNPFYACEPLMLFDEVHSQQGEVAISSDGLVAIAGGFATTVIDHSPARLYTCISSTAAHATHISMDGSMVLTGSLDGQVALTYLHGGSDSCRYGISVEGTNAMPTVRALDLSHDSNLLLLGGDAGGLGVVTLWRTRDNALLTPWPQPKPIWTVAMSPDGRLAAMGALAWSCASTRPRRLS